MQRQMEDTYGYFFGTRLQQSKNLFVRTAHHFVEYRSRQENIILNRQLLIN